MGRLYETAAGGTTTRFLYDGDEVIAEYNGSGTLLRRYVPGAAFDEHLVWYEGTSTNDRRYMAQDERGSVIATDASGGVTAYAYDEYGRPNAWGAPSSAPRFRYAAAMVLEQAQLYYMRARVYSPTLGRFLQTDPIAYAGGMSLYGYVGNDPVNWTDPLGLMTAEEMARFCAENPGQCVDVTGTPCEATLCLSSEALQDYNQRNPFSETIGQAEEEIVVTGQAPTKEPQATPPVRIPPWVFRVTPIGVFIWVFTPTDVADATCRSATNPGGYDCSPERSPVVGPPYLTQPQAMTPIDPRREEARDRCHERCWEAGQRRAPPGSERFQQYRRCMRSCMAEEGYEDW